MSYTVTTVALSSIDFSPMPLDLPAADSGPNVTAKSVTKSQMKRPAASARTKRSARPSSAGTSSGGLQLPPDDFGVGDSLFFDTVDDGTGFDELLGIGPKQSPNSVLVASPEEDLRTFDDPTLKAAASRIPSVVFHPFRDLDSTLASPPPCDPDLVDTLWEIYSVPRLGPIMNQLGGKSRRSYDLKHFWDLRDAAFQRCLLTDISILRPLGVMLSPPCTCVCQLMHSNWSRMDAKQRVLNLEDACLHIDLSMWIATFQLDHSRYFAFEHPGGSLAWDRESATQKHCKCSFWVCFDIPTK